MIRKRGLRPEIIVRKNMNLIFEGSSRDMIEEFWDEMGPEVMDIVHEAMIGPVQSMGFHIVVVDSGNDWIKWKVNRL